MCMIIVSCSIIYECCALPELLGTLLYDCVKLNQEGCQFHTSSWAKERLGSIDLCWTDKEIRFSQLFFSCTIPGFPACHWVSQTVTLQGFLATSSSQPIFCTRDCHLCYFPPPPATQSCTNTHVVTLGVIHEDTNSPGAKQGAGQDPRASSPWPFPPVFSDPPSDLAGSYLTFPTLILYCFHFSFKILHCTTFNSLRRQSILQHTLLLLSAKLHPQLHLISLFSMGTF